MKWAWVALVVIVTFGPVSRADLTWDAAERAITIQLGERSGRATFLGRNSGPSPVAITQLKSSCHCSVARISREVIPPGETAELAVEITLPKGAATAEATISAVTDAGRVATFKVTLKPAVNLTVTPSFVWWNAGADGTPRELIVEPSASAPDIAELRTSASDPTFHVECERIAGTRRWRARITPADTSKPRLATLTFEAAASDPPLRANAYAKIFPARKP